MAYAGARFANSLLRGLKGESNVIEPAYVVSDVTESEYFSTPLLLGKNGKFCFETAESAFSLRVLVV